MELTLTCLECKSAVDVTIHQGVHRGVCCICDTVVDLKIEADHINSILKVCPGCSEMDFYSQKDFSRVIGVSLFIIASVLSLYTYGISFIILYSFDYFLFKKLSMIAICYHCRSIFRNVCNIDDVLPYDHERNDRIAAHLYDDIKTS